MKIKQFPVNPFEMNCYVYYDENSKEGIIIDPGAYTEEERKRISDFINDEEITIKLIINTHGHLDHILGNKWAKDKFKVPVLMHEEDKELIEMAWQQASLFGISIDEIPPIDNYL